MKVGLLLLTGGQGSRMGAPKQNLVHPSGITWGSHLVTVFRSVFPDGPVQVLGEALVDHPDLAVMDDPRRGPAVALRHWAVGFAPIVDVWWVVACDQVRWCEEDLQSWSELARAVDPECRHWVFGRFDGYLQPLGGFLPHSLRPALAISKACSLWALAESLPHCILDNNLPGWRDVDTPEARKDFEAENRP
jgi:molybdopterin-guanine dinucleotide biosynthesis protein A